MQLAGAEIRPAIINLSTRVAGPRMAWLHTVDPSKLRGFSWPA